MEKVVSTPNSEHHNSGQNKNSRDGKNVPYETKVATKWINLLLTYKSHILRNETDL